MKRAQRPARHRMSGRPSPSSNSTSIRAIAGRLSARLQESFGLRCAQADAPSRLTHEPGTCPKGAGGRVLREGWKPDGRDRRAGSVRSTTARRRRSRRSPKLKENDMSAKSWSVIDLRTSSTTASDLWRTRGVGGWDKLASRGPTAPCLDRAMALGAWRARHLSRRFSACSERK